MAAGGSTCSTVSIILVEQNYFYYKNNLFTKKSLHVSANKVIIRLNKERTSVKNGIHFIINIVDFVRNVSGINDLRQHNGKSSTKNLNSIYFQDQITSSKGLC